MSRGRILDIQIFEESAAEYLKYLLDSGYSAQLINEKLNLIRALDRNCMMEDSKKKNEVKKGVLSALILDGHPAIPNGRKALKSANDILKLDKVANQMMSVKGRNISAVRRLPYLSEILGTGKDPAQLLAKQNIRTGYFGCKKCDLCKWSLFGKYVTNSASNMKYKIQKSLNCNSKFTIYIYFCSMGNCKELPYVGRADNLKTRHSNHKSHVKRSYKLCKLTHNS